MITREFTVGDRLTSLVADLYRPGDPPVPVILDPAETVVFRMVSADGIVKVDDQVAAIVTRGDLVTAVPAQVRYDWASADVDTVGIYAAWFIRISGGQTEHFPPQNAAKRKSFSIVIQPEN